MRPDAIRAAIRASDKLDERHRRRLLALGDEQLFALHQAWSLPGAGSGRVHGELAGRGISFDQVKDYNRVRVASTPPAPDPPPGLCNCGCGQPTPLWREHKPSAGRVKGEPMRYIPGHAEGQARPKVREKVTA